MKFYYAMAILVQLLAASLSGNKNKAAYMRYLWGNLLECRIKTAKNNVNSVSDFDSRKSKSETNIDKYTFLLER